MLVAQVNVLVENLLLDTIPMEIGVNRNVILSVMFADFT